MDLKDHETIMSYDDNYFIAAQPMPADIKLENFYMVAILMQTLAMIHTHGIHIVILYIDHQVIDKGGEDLFDFSQQENGVLSTLNPIHGLALIILMVLKISTRVNGFMKMVKYISRKIPILRKFSDQTSMTLLMIIPPIIQYTQAMEMTPFLVGERYLMVEKAMT